MSKKVGAALILVALLATPALGARAKGSIWIDDSYLRATDGVLNYQDPVNFGYVTVADWSTIQLQCFQGGSLVFADSRGTQEGMWGYGVPLSLGPSIAWQGGAADCVAKLGHRSNSGKYTVDAQLSFRVDA